MLSIQEVAKRYGDKIALENVNLEMSEGVYALLGPNGAGKSTLMKIITDSLAPTSGHVLWNKTPIQKLGRAYRSLLGYMPQQQGMYDAFTGRRFLAYMATLKAIAKKDAAAEIERVAKMVNLTEVLDRPVGAYSGGMKQRVLMAQAILGNPKLLIFDEPTAGLDPMERVRTRNFIAALAKDRIVLLATHVVSDIETIASRVVIIRSGCIVANAAPDMLVQQYAPGKGLEDVYVAIFGATAGETLCE
ncbi:MAG: ATP-binding cassette domain-containing protein [Oscillospiraceae bacterium]